MTAALVIGTLGISTYVSALSTLSPAEAVEKFALENSVDVEAEAEPKDALPATPIPADVAVDAEGDVIPQREAQQTPAPAADDQFAATPAFGVRLSRDGLLPGRFRYAERLNGPLLVAKRLAISFIQNRRVVARVRPGVDGVFQASGLAPGVYSMIANGPDGFLATAILVLPPVEGQHGAGDAGLQIDMALVSPDDSPLVRTMIRERIFPWRGDFESDLWSDGTQWDGTNFAAKPLSTPQLVIGTDGFLRGRTNWIDGRIPQRIPATRCTVWLIRGNEVRAKADIDDNGVFVFDAEQANLIHQEYSLLVTGRPPRTDDTFTEEALPRGRRSFAALGVTLVKASALPQQNVNAESANNPFRLVSAARLVAAAPTDNVIDVVDLIPPEDIEIEAELAADECEEGEGTACCTTCGGGGSGAGAGGGGGLGALGALLGGGALAAALLNDGGGTVGQPASPATVK